MQDVSFDQLSETTLTIVKSINVKWINTLTSVSITKKSLSGERQNKTNLQTYLSVILRHLFVNLLNCLNNKKILCTCHCSLSYHFELSLSLHEHLVIFWLILTKFNIEKVQNYAIYVIYMDQLFTVVCSKSSSAWAKLLFITVITICVFSKLPEMFFPIYSLILEGGNLVVETVVEVLTHWFAVWW